MDIDLLSKMVGELILDNDEVALPGVGTFVAELMPSTFSDKGYTINPPYRRLSFRQRESQDNRLVELYARSNGVDMQAAASILGSFLKEMKDILKVRKTIVFPGLGRLRATRENNFFFIPDEDLNIYPEGFGLEPVSLKTHVETEDEMRAAVASLQKIMDEPDEKEEPVAETVSIAETDPVAEEVPVEAEAPAAEAVPVEGAGETSAVRRRHPILRAVCIVLLALLLLLALFMLLARLVPDFIDKLLYSAEELDIIRQMDL